MQIFAKKAYRFEPAKPDPAMDPFRVDRCIIPAMYVGQVPDWVADSLAFQWAVKDGDIQVITPAVQVQVPEEVAPSTKKIPVVSNDPEKK